jgi:transcriptional regulator with XRE-family HTH domain
VAHTLFSRLAKEIRQQRQNAQSKSLQCCEMNELQCRLARTALGWGVRDLAKIASLSTQTISRFENGDELRPTTLKKLREVFEAAGIEFIDESDDKGVGVRLAKASDPQKARDGE